MAGVESLLIIYHLTTRFLVFASNFSIVINKTLNMNLKVTLLFIVFTDYEAKFFLQTWTINLMYANTCILVNAVILHFSIYLILFFICCYLKIDFSFSPLLIIGHCIMWTAHNKFFLIPYFYLTLRSRTGRLMRNFRHSLKPNLDPTLGLKPASWQLPGSVHFCTLYDCTARPRDIHPLQLYNNHHIPWGPWAIKM